jgi:2-methylcitrate dehydratase PrpD
MSLTRYVAEFLTGAQLDDVPAEVVHLAKRSILDGLGLALAGARNIAASTVREHVLDQGSSGAATILGTDQQVSPRFAALANGTAIHADDYDDTQLAVSSDRVYGLLTHPTAPVLPSVLALGEAAGASGAAVLTAYLVGVEVETKVSEAINPRHYEDGFHSTATVGAIGSAVGAARMMGLDAEAAGRAISLGATQAGGLRENFGTMTKPFHAGRAAESGVVAADLAARGFTAAGDILEARRGFFNAAGGGYEPDLIDGCLGNPWTFSSPGVSIKPHPSGSLTHPAMGAIADLIAEHDIRPEQVASVRVGTNRHMPNALIHHRPTNGLQAKFSMEFCMAILLLDRRAGLAEFTNATVGRADVRDMIERVTFEVDPVAEAAGSHTMSSLVEVRLADGRAFESRAEYGKGSPQKPMSDDELMTKFIECAEWGGLPRDRAQLTGERILRLEDEPDVRDLVAAANVAAQAVSR